MTRLHTPVLLRTSRRLATSMAVLSTVHACSWFETSSEQASATFDPAASSATVLKAVSADTPPEILPVKRGELVELPVDKSSQGRLNVLAVGPKGAHNQPRQAIVVFDRPVVALGSLDDPKSTVPLDCTGGGAGHARWAGTTTAVWIPESEDGFPQATEIRCSVPKGTAAVTGERLQQDISFAFHTPAPALAHHWPREGSNTHDPTNSLLLVFNQPMSPETVAKAVRLRGDDGTSVELTGRRPDKDPDNYRLPDDLTRAVELSGPMKRNTTYALTLASGLTGLEGPRGTTENLGFRFSTIPPAEIESFEPRGSDVDTYTWIRMSLATSTSGEEISPKVSISPAPPDGWNPAESYSSRYWSHGVRLAPMTKYTVTVEPGFVDAFGQKMAEGASWSFTTGHHDSLLDVATGPQTFPANNPSTLPLRTRNLEHLRATVTRVDPSWLIDNLDNRNLFSSTRARPMGDSIIDLSSETAIDDTVHLHELDLSSRLDEGRGLVLVEVWSRDVLNWKGKPQIHRSILQVTDLGTTLKAGPDGMSVWVTRLSDGAPVSGATVDLYRDGRPIWEGTTDTSGIAHAPDVVPRGWSPSSNPITAVVRLNQDVSVNSTSYRNTASLWSYPVETADVSQADEIRIHAFADRGVYRQGETAHIAANARLAHAGGLSMFPQTGDVKYSCEDARGAEFADGSLRADGYGAVSFDADIPKDAAMGEAHCRMTWSNGGLTRYAHISLPIYAFRTPTFRVDVSAPDHAVVGSKLSAMGHGRYLFGAAMGGADATWSIRAMEIDPEPDGWDEFFFGTRTRAWWEDDYSSETLIASGDAKVDKLGQIPIEADLAVTEKPVTRSLTVEVAVTDVSRQQIANRTQLTVHPADVYPGLRFASGLGEAQTPNEVMLVAVDPQGSIVEGVDLDVTVVQKKWDTIRKKGMDGRWTWENTTTEEEVAKETLKSGAQPIPYSWTPPTGGYYFVRVSARDAEGRLAQTEAGQYVAGSGATWARSDDQKLPLIPDKRRYTPGDVAKVLVRSPRPGLQALVTVEREGVLDRRVVELASTAETIEIPLGEDAVPNVFVSVVAVDGAPPADSPDGTTPSWHLGYMTLPVEPAGRRLDVDLSTDAESYQPGQEVTATVSVAREGGSVSGAHVVLWAVDYGVLSLTGYETPSAFETYYAHHPLRVVTADTRTHVLDRANFLTKGGRAAGGGGGEALDGMRSRFVTTPYWNADLVTGPDGTVTTTFQLPDNLTTFQLMAVVDEGSSSFGAGDKQLQVTRPIIAQPALPRVMRIGDAAYAGVVVHNNRDEQRTIQVTATASGVTLSGSPKEVEIPANGAVEVPFHLSDPTPGTARFTFEAIAGEDRDAVTVTVPVERPIPVETVATAGILDPDATETIAEVEGALPGAGGLDVVVSSTVMVGADTAMEFLLDYRWSCLEQTSSRLVAALVARELGEDAGLTLSSTELDKRIATHLAKYSEYAHPSGGLSLWPGASTPNALATAYATEVRQMAGQRPSKETIRFLRAFLKGKWMPRYWSEEARVQAQVRVALALARVGQGDAGHNSVLYRAKNTLPLATRAELAEAIALTSGSDSRTLQLLTEAQGGIYTEATTAVIREPDETHTIWGAEMTATAATMDAMMVIRPDDPLLPRLAQGLVQTRRGGYWGNTYTTARALRVLLQYVRAYETEEGPRSVTVQLGRRSLLEGAALTSTGSLQASVGIDDKPWGELTLQAEGGRAYYESRLSYATASMPPRDAGFTLVRNYRMLEGSGASTRVTPGGLVQVELRISTPIDRTDVVVHDPLPAGLEPVNTFFETTASSTEEYEGHSDSDADWWSSWVFSHRAMGDADLTLFADYMPAGVHVYTYVARATTPGDYALPAARVEQMYRPEVFGRTEQTRFVVGAAPLAKLQ